MHHHEIVIFILPPNLHARMNTGSTPDTLQRTALHFLKIRKWEESTALATSATPATCISCIFSFSNCKVTANAPEATVAFSWSSLKLAISFIDFKSICRTDHSRVADDNRSNHKTMALEYRLSWCVVLTCDVLRRFWSAM